MIRLGVLVSGRGSNLSAILTAIAEKRLAAEVAIVISNVPDAPALARAAEHGVPTEVVPHRDYPDRKSFDRALVDILRAHQVDYVVLAGFMRVITSELLWSFPSRILNVHPSLLPAFPGMHAQKQALDYGVKIAGCTVHLVDEGTDTGPILAQAAVSVLESDDEAALSARILSEEHRLLVDVLSTLAVR